ncbi:MAG: TetR/AcrR family transcriptional regulator [Actinobacteria bacterium]|nr:TetR/AcrR family transcriptional regulator [Actinomycetota bacterium]
MNRRLTTRGKERRRQLLEFATQRFADNGYHPTSVAEIVQGLGVGKGVFYWYFDSKEQLFIEILREAQQDLRRTQQQAIEGEDDPIARIELGIRSTMLWSAEHENYYKLTQFAITEERFLPSLRKGQEVAIKDVMRHVQDGIDRGLIRDTSADYIAQGILGLSTQLVRVFIHEKHRSPDEVADEAIALILDGIHTGDRSAAAPI